MKKVQIKRPVIRRVALTNNPHIRLKDHPISIVDGTWFEEKGIKPPRPLKEDEKLVRVPFFVAGKYYHPHGILDLDEKVFDQMIENSKKGIADSDEGLDYKHDTDAKQGSLAWFSLNDGGWFAREGNTLVGYGVPTDEEILNIVERKKFKYSSVEFHPNYRSNVKEMYLSEQFTEEITMEEERDELLQKISDLEQELADLRAEKEEATKLADELASKVEAIKKLESKVQELTLKLEEKEEEIPEDPRIIALEQKLEQIQREKRDAQIDALIQKATVPVDGKVHSPILLEAVSALLKGEGKISDKVIKLEETENGLDVNGFIYQFAEAVLTTVPREYNAASTTVALEEKEVDKAADLVAKGKAFATELWGVRDAS